MNEPKHCPLLNKQCIATNCQWFVLDYVRSVAIGQSVGRCCQGGDQIMLSFTVQDPAEWVTSDDH